MLKTAGKTSALLQCDPAGHLLAERDTTGSTIVWQDTVYLRNVPLADINPDSGTIIFQPQVAE